MICRIFKRLSFVFLLFSFLFSTFSCTQNLPTISSWREDQIATGDNFVIATQGEAASRAGALMFERGGNTVDAAVAVSFAISVERQESTGIGGGGFILIYDARSLQTFAVDFRERAPLKADEKLFLDKNGKIIDGKSTEGIFSAAVPGTVAGLVEVHKRFGKLPLNEVMTPAIELAGKGFKINEHLANAIDAKKDLLQQYPSSAKIFLHNDGSPKKAGEILVQNDLARTLDLISKKGGDGFYKGTIAKAIIAEGKKLGGLITEKDLNNYKVVWRKPVSGFYLGYKVVSMPPPSSGGVHVIEILNILEEKKVRGKPYSTENIHTTAAAMQRAFADRAKYLGDTDFVKVPIETLIDKNYAKKIANEITPKARPSSELQEVSLKGHESNQTTHFSIMDKEGNVVTSTQTINGWLGSGVVVPGTGIILNNEMDDFAASIGASNMFGAIGGSNNLIAPGKRPLSSMSPTIVFDKGNRPFFSLGSPSGTRIITCVTLVIQNKLAYNLTYKDAVAALRYHHQWMPDTIFVEPPYLNTKVEKSLIDKGYNITEKPLGCDIQLVAREGTHLIAVADPRGVGKAIGK